MKKILNYIFAAGLSSLALVGCTDEVKFGGAFIEKAPGGTVTFDTIFSNAEYANQFLTAIYSRQYYGLSYSNDVGYNSASPYTGKLDGFTDLYQLHWEGCMLHSGYYTGTLTASNTPLISYSNDLVWDAVRQVWLLIENIDRVPDLTTEKRDYMVAQAKMLLANRYFDLLPFYGGLPLVNKSYTGTESDFTLPRMTFEATVDTIVKWIDESADYLPWAYNGNTTETNSMQTGRWTKAGALALKAKVLWLAASPIFNADKPYYDGSTQAEQEHLVWYGDFQQSRWDRALKAFEDFNRENAANGDYYHLVQATKKTCDGYRIAYRRGYILDDSPENIHWTKVCDYYGTQKTYCWLNWSWEDNGVKRLIYSPTVEYVEMFPWSNGKPFDREADMTLVREDIVPVDDKTDYTWEVYTNNKLFYEYKSVRGGMQVTASRDPRLYENARVSGQKKKLDWNNENGVSNGDIVETWVGGEDASFDVLNSAGLVAENLCTMCPTGFGAYKYILSKDDYWRDYNMHWNVLTIPDMILMYAECLAQTGNLTDAIKQVDLIRSRVGLNSINASYNRDKQLATNKDNLIEEILRERACELGMTNARYIDMVRYKRTDWLTKQLHGMATYRLMRNAQNKAIRRLSPYKGNDMDAGMPEPSEFEYQFFPLSTTARQQWGKDPNSLEIKKWLMMAFPQVEINKNYGLVQNPGW